MPLGCLLDVSRMPPKCPLGEIYKQQNNLFTADEACHVAVNMWGFKVSKRSVFAILSRKRVRDASIYASKKYRSSFYS